LAKLGWPCLSTPITVSGSHVAISGKAVIRTKAALERKQNKTSKEEIAVAEAEFWVTVAQLAAIRKMRHRA
jgi:hypothetical protein